MKKECMESAIENIYCKMDGSEVIQEYHIRHNINSACILTITSKDKAKRGVNLYKKSLENKVVIEIGAGIGLFALEIAKIAKEVIAIEADPAWSWVFTKYLYINKPKNLTWIFGNAETMINKIKGDVCIFCSHSDLEGLNRLAKEFAPKVIMVYQNYRLTDKYLEQKANEIQTQKEVKTPEDKR